jgi:putative transposase
MRRRHQRLDFARTIHFVTTVTRDRGMWFTSDRDCIQILSTFERYRIRYGLECLGYVLMPDHLHVLLRQVENGSLVSNAVASFKRETSKSLSIAEFSAKTLWRDYYDDVPIPGIEAIMKRLVYMHANPVRREIVAEVTDYKWSSARFYYELDSSSLISITRP